MNKYLAEFVGTFALVFIGTGSVVVNSVNSSHPVGLVGISLAFGLIVMAVIYAIGPVSGAHLNPAVTLGLLVAGRFSIANVIPYIVSQVAGALAASYLLRSMFGNIANLGATMPAGAVSQSLIMEIVLTAILMFVIMCVATGSKEQGLMAGLAIGAVVVLDILVGGPVSGASMNPARSIGPAIAGDAMKPLWIYIVGPIVGVLIAVPLWAIICAKKPAASEE